MRRFFGAVCLLWMAVALSTARAGQGQDIPSGYEVGLHIVREGDTLRGITRAYLGSDSLWEKNWALNPEVTDPDRLLPMQRLRVLLAPRVARPTAKVISIAGEVDGKPAPADWSPSVQDDLMLERDGVRAGKDGSGVVEFQDGSRLKVADESTVFFRVAGRTLRGVEQRAVEIVRGEADLQAVELDASTEIEMIVGRTVAKPKVGPAGQIETRARRADDGGAKLMVFEGESEVEAGGAKVAVGRGMGTSVPKSGPPAPPEKLLPAPDSLAPGAGAEYELGSDRLTWQRVSGAASYTLEICRDAACNQLALRRVAVPESSWEVGQISPGDYFWRVMAVSGSGLDGYASAPQAVRFVPFVADGQAPTGSLSLHGTSVTNKGVTYWAPALEVRLDAEDEGTGVTSVTVTVNGEHVPTSRLAGPWETGDYEVVANATDGAGNEGVIGPLAFAVDADPPDVSWSTGGLDLLSSTADAPRDRRRWERRLPRWIQARQRVIEGGRARPLWQVLAWSASEQPTLRRLTANLLARRDQPSELRISREEVRMLLLAPALVLPDDGRALGKRFLRLEVADERSGMTWFHLRRADPSTAGEGLEIDVVDRLENRQVKRLDFGALPSD